MFVHHVFIFILFSIKALSTVNNDILSVGNLYLAKETFIVHINSMHKNKLSTCDLSAGIFFCSVQWIDGRTDKYMNRWTDRQMESHTSAF